MFEIKKINTTHTQNVSHLIVKLPRATGRCSWKVGYRLCIGTKEILRLFSDNRNSVRNLTHSISMHVRENHVKATICMNIFIYQARREILTVIEHFIVFLIKSNYFPFRICPFLLQCHILFCYGCWCFLGWP